MTTYRDFTFTVVAASSPTWLASVPEMTWTPIAAGPDPLGVTTAAWQRGTRLHDARYQGGTPNVCPVHGAESGARQNPTGTYFTDPLLPGLWYPGVTSYSGGAADSLGGRLVIAGGGHGAYEGNEPYTLNLRQPIPAWSNPWAPSPGTLCAKASNVVSGDRANDANYHGSWPTDTEAGIEAPMSQHTYGHLFCTPNGAGGSRFWWGTNGYGATGTTADIHYLDMATGQWRWVGRRVPLGALPADYEENSFSVYVSGRDEIWGFHANGSPQTVAYRIAGASTASPVVTRYTYLQLWRPWAFTPVVEVPGRMFIDGRPLVVASPNGANYGAANGPYIFDPYGGPSGPGNYSPNHNGSYVPNPTQGGYYPGLPKAVCTFTNFSLALDTNNPFYSWTGNGVWHEQSSSILYMKFGEKWIYQLTPPANGNAYSGQWTMRKIDAAISGNPLDAIGTANGPYGRCNIVNNLDGAGTSLLVRANYFSGRPAYVLKLPNGALP